MQGFRRRHCEERESHDGWKLAVGRTLELMGLLLRSLVLSDAKKAGVNSLLVWSLTHWFTPLPRHPFPLKRHSQHRSAYSISPHVICSMKLS